MPVDLTRPVSWLKADTDELAMLADLQANILKGHGRRASRHLFLQFATAEAGRAFLHAVAPLVSTAIGQLRQAALFRATTLSGGPIVCVYLSAAGYRFLERDAKMPQPSDGSAFSTGLAARAVGDDWSKAEAGYREDIHAKLLIAGDPDNDDSWTSQSVDRIETELLNMLGVAGGAAGEGGRVVASESGRAIFNKRGDGLEHFGYVDGRSQPLLLTEDIATERAGTGIDKWDPSFPIGQVLFRDPGSPDPHAFGSFLVVRKLEQDVDAFKTREDQLGDDLHSGEQAGATIVGRYEDGTPIVMQPGDGLHSPVTNNFNYDGDVDGGKCPLHAHIRKTNPRGDSVRQFGVPIEQERGHIMARRAIPFGRRDKIVDPSDRPSGDVGLLFMAHQSNLANQFEFTQQSWANNSDFLRTNIGKDPIIGQPGPFPLAHFKTWGEPAAGTAPDDFGGFVTFRGGEYFFAPAISVLAQF